MSNKVICLVFGVGAIGVFFAGSLVSESREQSNENVLLCESSNHSGVRIKMNLGSGVTIQSALKEVAREIESGLDNLGSAQVVSSTVDKDGTSKNGIRVSMLVSENESQVVGYYNCQVVK